MKQITAYLPIVLIVLLFLAGFIGYNKLIGNQARQTAIHELTVKRIEEMNTRHQAQLDSLESLKSIVLHQDSLIKKQNEKLIYIEKQNDVLYSRYSDISIKLPEL